MPSQPASKSAKNASPHKKGSKLESLKNLFLGSKGSKDSAKKTAAAPAKAGKGAAPAKAPAKAAAPAHAPKAAAGKGAAPATGKKAAEAAPAHAAGKKGAAAPLKNGAHKHGPSDAKAAAKAAAASSKSLSAKLSGRASARDLADSESVCREVACENLATTGGYCRVHYIRNWKKIKRKEVILQGRKLNQYIEELVAKYPEKYLEAIRQDLASDKDFAKVIYDLDLDESVDDFEVDGDESLEGVIEGVKGGRDFDDEGETF